LNFSFYINIPCFSEGFRSIIASYIRGAAAAIAGYDITDRRSYESAKTWVEELRQKGEESCVIALVGNKADLIEERRVQTEDAEVYAEENDLLFMETSAKTGMNVNELFEMIVRRIDFECFVTKH
jgi:Ras-related protein Rab-5C